jgi:hypothetical protein
MHNMGDEMPFASHLTHNVAAPINMCGESPKMSPFRFRSRAFIGMIKEQEAGLSFARIFATHLSPLSPPQIEARKDIVIPL